MVRTYSSWRKIFGVILGILISSLLTYSVINTFHFGGRFLPDFILSFQDILTLLSIAAVGGFIGGFVSRNVKTGFLSGLLAGIIGVLLVIIFFASYMYGFQAGFLLTSQYQNLLTYILFGLIGGTAGVAGAWIETKLGVLR